MTTPERAKGIPKRGARASVVLQAWKEVAASAYVPVPRAHNVPTATVTVRAETGLSVKPKVMQKVVDMMEGTSLEHELLKYARLPAVLEDLRVQDPEVSVRSRLWLRLRATRRVYICWKRLRRHGLRTASAACLYASGLLWRTSAARCPSRQCVTTWPICAIACLLSPSRQTRHSHCAPLCFAVCDHRDVHSLKVKSCGHFRLPHPMSFTHSTDNDR